MKVREMMSEPVLTCTPETTIAAAARLMRDADYGTLPVLDASGRMVGILTDRDICKEIANSNRNGSQIAVHEAMSTTVQSCRMDDDVETALAALKRAKVRRLPVLDATGKVKGMLSTDDVVVRGLESGGVSKDSIVLTLKTIFERRPAAASVSAADLNT